MKFDGKELANADDLVRALAGATPGTSAKLQIWRNGAAKELTVKLGEADGEQVAQRQKPQAGPAESDRLGLAVRQLSRDEQRALQTDGYLVVEAVAGIAAESGIQPGDIIIAINSQRVSGIRQLREELVKVGKRAALLVQRDGVMIFIPLKFKDE